MNNVGIDIIAAFNPQGEIKPVYMRLEDESHMPKTYKLEIIDNKSEKYSGINSILYCCSFLQENIKKEVKVRYYIDSHKWAVIN